jgi:hypothetical protein
VDREDLEARALVVEQEAVDREVTDIDTRTLLGIDAAAHGQNWTIKESGNQTREFGRVGVVQPSADACRYKGDLFRQHNGWLGSRLSGEHDEQNAEQH